MGAEGEDLLVFPVDVELQEAQAGEAVGGMMEVAVEYGGQTSWMATETAVSSRRSVSMKSSPWWITDGFSRATS